MVTASKYGPEKPPYFDTFQAMVGVNIFKLELSLKKCEKEGGKWFLSITKCVLQTIWFLVYFCKLLCLFAIISLSVLRNEPEFLKSDSGTSAFL